MSKILEYVSTQYSSEEYPLYHQVCTEILNTLSPFLEVHPEYVPYATLFFQPERVIQFRVPWIADDGSLKVNRGYRVQFNSAIGPYKGGLRFHPSVNVDTFLALACEQCFKNALTGLPMGGGKGGSDFDPKGKSDNEIMRFCQSFMSELYKYIGEDVDVPAGDIGVDGRAIGYMFGEYKRLAGRWGPILTGKPVGMGGSLIRNEATGYGIVYFLQAMMNAKGKTLDKLSVAVSGSGNVALHCAEKLIEFGAKVLTLSDSAGYIYFEKGMTTSDLEEVKTLKNVSRGRLSEIKIGKYFEGEKPWSVKCDVALPAATQNEVDVNDVKKMLSNGVIAVCEGANFPLSNEAIDLLHENKIMFGPAKAANAGGVMVSGFEISQNMNRLYWSTDHVDKLLMGKMNEIYDVCESYGKEFSDGEINLAKGANIAGAAIVFKAMKNQGWV